MPKPSIKITFAASKLALWSHALLGLTLIALVLVVAGAGVALLVILLLIWPIQKRRRAPVGQLGLDVGQRWAQWSWRETPSSDWRTVALDCDYLGPWLIGLKLDGQRLWVWPDSSDAASRRLLRRALVRLP